jgi:hypothetical protein
MQTTLDDNRWIVYSDSDTYTEDVELTTNVVSSESATSCQETFVVNSFCEFFDDFDIFPLRINDYNSQWILRVGRFLKILFVIKPIRVVRRFKRKLLRCDRRGIGLRIRAAN